MKVSLLSIRSTQNTAKNKQAKNSLQHPDVPSATSYWFSGALLVDLFSKEQALRCLYNLRISTKWDWVSQKRTFICDEEKSQMRGTTKQFHWFRRGWKVISILLWHCRRPNSSSSSEFFSSQRLSLLFVPLIPSLFSGLVDSGHLVEAVLFGLQSQVSNAVGHVHSLCGSGVGTSGWVGCHGAENKIWER